MVLSLGNALKLFRSLFSGVLFGIVVSTPAIGYASGTADAAPSLSGALPQIRSAIEAREYWVTPTSAGLQAPNRAQRMRSYFDASGLRVTDRESSRNPLVGLSLTRIGRLGSIRSVPEGKVRHDGARVEIARPGLTEWFINSAAGLEQGFTLMSRPAAAVDPTNAESAAPTFTPLTLEIDVSHAEVSGSATRLVFSSTSGRRLEYTKLVVEDANRSTVPAHFEVLDEGFRIVVDDESAVYPLVIDPILAGIFDTEFESNQVTALLGMSVAGAGDVNADGYADVIVGATRFDSGETDEGAAFVFLGSASGVADGNPINAHAMIESNQASALLGGGVASAGDVNGDGYDDVIVGSGNFSNGQINEGVALVFHGGPAGIADGNPSTADALLEGDQANANFGAIVSQPNHDGCVASAGDVNGDGYADVIVGATRYTNGENGEGAAFIFHGSASGVSSGSPATADTFLESNQTPAGTGQLPAMGVVSSAGDVNGDGYSDVIVGARAYVHGTDFSGVAWVFHGGPAGVPDGNPSTADGTIGVESIS